MSAIETLKVTSHVGRDLLASAASFKSEALVVWEYVANSLQYVDQGVPPRIQVSILPGTQGICISDNGSGMDVAHLEHFFRMHDENLERRAGRPGRGKWGTGKSAAFGIANELVVDTIRNKKRNVVSLTRKAVVESDGSDIPLQWNVRDEPVDSPNGTTVYIRQLNIDRVRRPTVIEYIERHLQTFRSKAPEVAIDDHVCSYREPATTDTFEFTPSDSQRKILGDVTLFVKVSPVPLPPLEQGITVTAGAGNFVAIERAGIESKEYGNCLFGEIDVPELENHPSPIEPYDPTRSLQLNPQHPVVAVLLGFIGSKLEDVRSDLVRRSRDARKTEQARRLASEADRIAEILNKDFRQISERLNEIRAASSRSGSARSPIATMAADQIPDDWTEGTELPGMLVRPASPPPPPPNPAPPSAPPEPRPVPELRLPGRPDEEGDNAVDPVGGDGGQRRRPQGGFRVEYRGLGHDEDRSVYDSNTLTIFINLDHPLVATALGEGSVQDPTFRRLSYEIAFSEYALGLGHELLKQDASTPPDDLLYEVRSTLNRISSAAVDLYR